MILFLKQRISLIIFIIAIVIYSITALNSHGYYHGDEHYQIIEFANYKLGKTAELFLPWEFKEEIRPTLQVNLAYIILKTFHFIGISNPFTQQSLLRLLTSLLTLFSLRFFINSKPIKLKSAITQFAFKNFSYFLWFFPLFAARYSSENMASVFLLLSLGYYFNKRKSLNWYLFGLCLGISFLFRFQMAFAILGFLIWLISYKKASWLECIQLCLGFLGSIIFGIINDYWFYGKVVFTPWNYFQQNIIEGAAANFGTSPWHYYLVSIIEYCTLPISLLFYFSLVVLLLFKPKQWSLFIIIPFIFFHSLVDHKEIRFLFPIAFLVPIVMFEAKKLISNKLTIKSIRLNYAFLIIFIGANFWGIAINALKPAGNGSIGIAKFIDSNYGNKPINLIHTNYANPYDPWGGLYANYYKKENIQYTRIKNLCEIDTLKLNHSELNILIMRQYDYERDPCLSTLEKEDFIYRKLSIPDWMKGITDSYHGFNNDNILILFEKD